MTDMFNSHFSINKIIFVNSAGHGYSELDLDEHLAMIGNNNLGKTASLSATKLILYPEVNFKNCEKKFNFISKSGKCFGKEESYEYYFPDKNSYLLMEVNNHVGEFCIVLFKAGNYEYNRMFIPVPYASIRDIFWDVDVCDFSKNLNLQNLKDAVKAHHGVIKKDKKEIRELMYGNLSGNDSKYCVVPLIDQKESSVNAFTRIFELAFNVGKDDEKTLPEAIATIIEMKRGRDAEKMDADVERIEHDYLKLIEEGTLLRQYEQHAEEYDAIIQRYERLTKDAQRYAFKYHQFNQKLQSEKTLKKHEQSQLADKLSPLETQKTTLEQSISQLTQQQARLHGDIEGTKQRIDTLEDKIHDIKTLLNNADCLEEAFEERIKKEIADQKHTLDALQDQEKTQALFKLKNKEKRNKQKRVESNKQAIDNFHAMMLSQLDEHSASVLDSLNADIGALTVALEDDEINTVKAFTSLFTEYDFDLYDSQPLAFKAEPLANTAFKLFDQDAYQQKLVQENIQLVSDIKQLDKEIVELNILLKNNSLEDSKLAVEQRIQHLTANLNLVRGKQTIENNLTEENSKLKALSTQLTQIHTQLTNEQKQSEQLVAQWHMLKLQDSEFSKFFNNCDTIETTLRNANKRYPLNVNTDQYSMDLAQPDISTIDLAKTEVDFDTLHIDIETANTILDQAENLKDDRGEFKRYMDQFMHAVRLAEVDNDIERFSLADYEKVIAQYNNVFANLTLRRNQYNKDIKTHNSFLSNLLAEMQNAHAILKSTIGDINQVLSKQQVSNFQSVKLHLTTKADFQRLLDTATKYDMSKSDLLDADFYASLIHYVKQHSNAKNKRLRMIDIIESIHYHYIKADGTPMTKAQSGGTTSTVSAFIISILLNRIFTPNFRLNMPIIIDEIADIDKHNIKTVVEQISREGFSIFCATPHDIPVVFQSIGRKVNIDYCRLQQSVMNNDCHLNILPSHIDRYGKMAS